MAGIYSQGGSAGHRYAGWLSEVEAKNFQFGGKVFNGSPSAIYVGSNLVWGSDWLTVAAQKAIRGAFGQRDGMAVIKATNAYLNQLAASDRDKATALAGFINEDPMMVCSLGLQPQGVTMPIRKIVGNGSGYFTTGDIFELTDAIECIYKRNTGSLSTYVAVFGTEVRTPSRVGFALMHTSGNLEWSIAGASSNQVSHFDETTRHKITMTNGKMVALNLDTQTSVTVNYTAAATPPSGNGFGIFAMIEAGSATVYAPLPGEVEHLHIIKSDNTYRHRLVPYRKPSGDSYTCELLDLETGTLATRVGTFTIPDISYTPSTP